MLPVEKILCPSDFSDPSLSAITVANELAAHFRAELYILHVVAKLPPLNFSSPAGSELNIDLDIQAYQRGLVENAHRKIDSIILERIFPELKVHGIVLSGDASYQIIEYSNMINADLIVISTHGLTGWKLIMFGSVADKVVKLARCPVLTVHRGDALR